MTTLSLYLRRAFEALRSFVGGLGASKQGDRSGANQVNYRVADISPYSRFHCGDGARKAQGSLEQLEPMSAPDASGPPPHEIDWEPHLTYSRNVATPYDGPLAILELSFNLLVAFRSQWHRRLRGSVGPEDIGVQNGETPSSPRTPLNRRLDVRVPVYMLDATNRTQDSAGGLYHISLSDVLDPIVRHAFASLSDRSRKRQGPWVPVLAGGNA